MRDRLEALPEVSRGQLCLDGCVHARTVVHGPIVRALHWNCRSDGEALRAERSHTAFVLGLVQSGACRVHDGRWNVTLDPATAVFHRPGAAYKTTHPFGLGDSGWNFAIREDVAADALDRVGAPMESWTRPSMTVAARPASLALPSIILLERSRRGKPVDRLELEEACFDIFHQLAWPAARRLGAARAATRKAHHRVAERTRAYLNEHFREALHLERIGKEVGASPAHLCRVFRRHVRITIGGYLKRLRLAAALDAIVSGRESLADVAVNTGFYSHSHMTSTFADETGVPPRDVRRWLDSGSPPLRAGKYVLQSRKRD